VTLIDTPSQSVRSSFQLAEPEPIRVSVNMSGESSRQKFKPRVVSAAKKLVSGGHSVQLDTCMPHHRPINATHGAGKKETSRAPACHRKGGLDQRNAAPDGRMDRAANYRAFPWSEAPRYLIRDQDGIYGCPCRKLDPHILMMQSAQDGAAV
jgi:hypothetical protein